MTEMPVPAEEAEKVARAIFDKECRLAPAVMRHADFEDRNTKLWYVGLAQAAIAAIRNQA